MITFKNKIVLITGAAQGIGMGIAKEFAKKGGIVVIADRNKEKLTSQGRDLQTLETDLSKKGAAQQMIQKVVKKFGRIDVLVNNARAGRRVGMLEETEASWEEGTAVTLRAVFFGSQEAVRAMKETGGGSIINISSVEGYMAGFDSPAYHASKSAVLHLTKYMALHAGAYGVRVNCVVPGFIIKDEDHDRFYGTENTKFRETAHFIHPQGNTGTSEDVAQAVMFLASDDAKFITGQSLVVDGGLTMQEQSNLVFRAGKLR